MYYNPAIVKRIVKSGVLEYRYNPDNFIYKYELGYMETVQDVNNFNNQPVSGPYKMFRPIMSFRNHEKAMKEFTKITAKP